jgi:hypothetical protein
MNIRTRTVVSAFVAVILAGAPFGHAGGDVRRIVIEEALSIGTIEDDLLYQLTGVAVDSEGFIYVLDGMDYSLKKFDAGGRLVRKAGRKGQGPGEFRAPRLLDYSGSRLFATDQNNPGIQVFDRDLTFKTAIPCRSAVQAMRALGPDKVAVLTMRALGASSLQVLNAEGTILSELSFADKKAGLLMDSASFTVLPDGSFVIAYLFQDRVERWTAEGRRIWSRAVFGPKKVPTTKMDSPLGSLTLPTETCFHDIAADSRGHLFVLGGRMAKNAARDVFVLDADGRLLTTLTLPDTSHCLVIDGKDQLYVRANEGITLKKYRLRYE